MKKKLIILIGIALVLIGIIGGSSFAYFTITDSNGNENVITSGTMALNLTDGQQITVNNLAPGQYLEKEFSVTNTGNVNASYDIYLSEVVNEFADKTDLVYELISLDGGYNTQNQIQVPDVSTKIINQQIILPSATHHYKLKITFLNKQENQNDNMNKFFMAKIQMNTYENINTTVKYYLDNVEVANLPTQISSNYISSSCNNNVNITFNQEQWTYQISNLNQNNTVCNIYFERKSVTITYDVGEGSINPTSEEVQYGNTLTLPTPTSPEGYTFIGWYTEENGEGTQVDNTTTWITSQTIHAYYVQSSYSFEYTGNVQTFTVPVNGKYKLEVWGAQGGSVVDTYYGGYGGYSTGIIELNDNENIDIYVGGTGISDCYYTCYGGYNGGGNGQGYGTAQSYSTQHISASGGGATHIATTNNEYNILSSYGNSDIASNFVLIVAAGGGGGHHHTLGENFSANGASGGGYLGNNGAKLYNGKRSTGGTQTTGGTAGVYGSDGKFGLGGTSLEAGSGGGAGWYGGGSGSHDGASGGSGYIASTNLTNKHMTCYNCATSTDENTYTQSNSCHNLTATPDCAKEGNGYARITLVSAN